MEKVKTNDFAKDHKYCNTAVLKLLFLVFINFRPLSSASYRRSVMSTEVTEPLLKSPREGIVEWSVTTEDSKVTDRQY